MRLLLNRSVFLNIVTTEDASTMHLMSFSECLVSEYSKPPSLLGACEISTEGLGGYMEDYSKSASGLNVQVITCYKSLTQSVIEKKLSRCGSVLINLWSGAMNVLDRFLVILCNSMFMFWVTWQKWNHTFNSNILMHQSWWSLVPFPHLRIVR